MRASRLLSILMLLQARGRLSAQALADAVEVSVRTVYRDVDQLSAAGVPVYAERGRSGGFQLRDGWQTRLTGLTGDEARALFVAALPGPAAELGLAAPALSAQRKMLAALPGELQHDAAQAGARFHLDPQDWYRETAPTEFLSAVAEAVWSACRIRVRYESWQGESERELEPLGLVLKAGAWYMAARRGPGEPPRTYRLAAIRGLVPTGRRFRRPRRFDLAAYWRESTRRFEAELYRGHATLLLTPLGARLLESTAAAAVVAALRRSRVVQADGRGRVEIPIESPEQAARLVLRLGDEAEVLAPAALRERVHAVAQAVARRHAPARSGRSA